MKLLQGFCLTALMILSAGGLSSFDRDPKPKTGRVIFPYKQAGLTERQAAAHLLNRFTYGATPTQVEAVTKMGLEKWFAQQLRADLPDDSLNSLLSHYYTLGLTNEEVVNAFLPGSVLLRMAVREGVIDKDSIGTGADRSVYKERLLAYMQKKGFKPQQELLRQFFNQKILRATYTNNQLREVMTDFWFNHFYVSFAKKQCEQFIPSYERDVIRPNALGRFDQLLLATAKSPAMLHYLDLYNSVGDNSKVKPPAKNNGRKKMVALLSSDSAMEPAMKQAEAVKTRPSRGLNENYAREVMELHTVGVDGGYTQEDVTQAARVLTGWTVFPLQNLDDAPAAKEKLIDNVLRQPGVVHDGDFLFVPNRHDTAEKTVLGHHFPAGGGYDEGVTFLTFLAHHPSTAKFITKKIAVRFVSDDPPQSLLDKMAQSFNVHNGDIPQVLLTMVSSKEFWSAGAVRQKIKSPFELAVSSVRELGATVQQPYQLYNWIGKMGQQLYYYQAPTGFPDKGSNWINTGSLLNRMNFGLALAMKRIPGVNFDLMALNHDHEPESAQAALETYAKLMMPERNLDLTVKLLMPMLNEPELANKVGNAVGKNTSASMDMGGRAVGAVRDSGGSDRRDGTVPVAYAMETTKNNNALLAQVVGVIIGSPEFQRR